MSNPLRQRRPARVTCTIPARLALVPAPVDVILVDVSRSGVRMRIPAGALDITASTPLSKVAMRVATVLGKSFEGTLLPDRLGNLVTKTFRAVRIGLRDRPLPDVEVGCSFAPALTDLEVSMLGLALPQLRPDGSEDAAVVAPTEVTRRVPGQPPRGAPPPRTPAAPRLAQSPPSASPLAAPPAAPVGASASARASLARWRAYVQPTADHPAPPFLAAAESVSRFGVQLRVMDRSTLALTGERDVAGTILALERAYGADVVVKLVDGPTHVWTGPARIAEVEVPSSAPEQIALWLRFSRDLRPAELQTISSLDQQMRGAQPDLWGP